MLHLVMFCGNFSHIEDEDPWATATTRKSRRKDNKNPYSARGLDKFSTVLAELESRKEDIIAKMGSDPDNSLVRFVYSNSNEWVPVVVKIKDQKQPKSENVDHKNQASDQKLQAVDKAPTTVEATKERAPLPAAPVPETKEKKGFWWGVKEGGLSLLREKPYSHSMVMILILFCLVFSGRAFAVFCTSIWWYLVPTEKSGHINGRRPIKKEYGRRLSGDQISKLTPISSPRHHHANGKRA